MDAKQAGQVGAAGLAFALVGFVLVVALGVYVLYYQDDSIAPSSDKKSGMYARAMVHASQPMPPMPPMPPMNNAPLPPMTYPAPPLPAAVPSGVVGSFFDDELPAA